MKPETCSFKLHEASGCWLTIHGRQVLRDNIGTARKEKSDRPYLFWSSCMARTGRHGSTPWERMPPCEVEKLLWSESYESNADSRVWKTCRMNQMLTKRLTPVAKNLQSWMSVEPAADARGNEFPLHRLACINAWHKWNQRPQVPPWVSSWFN